ncbi:MAG TPA: nickel-dependent hydrogenase large subunit [Armatimonadota bacterium]|jgi:hydrogenase large subunit
MATIAAIDPVTRLEGHLKIDVTIDTVNGVQQVVDAKATGTLFRGFESILVNRDPNDAQHITERICGVCPVSHGMAAVLAQEAASRMSAPTNARIMRNLVLGANFLQSHILHFYHLTLPDFINGPNMPPWQPSWSTDRRVSATDSNSFVSHYLTALDMRRKAHEMGALYGGRMPHPPSFIGGGITTTPRTDRVTTYQNYLNTLIPFITNTYIPDVAAIASVYADYAGIGKGVGNLLAYGVFDQDSAGTTKLLRRGRIVNGTAGVQAVDPNAIAEQVTYSWYADSTNNLKPASGVTAPQFPKGNAYSWLKAPRYLGLPYETGPLARMKVNGDYTGGVSVMDRHKARAAEALKVAKALQTWVGQLSATGAVYTRPTPPTSATSYGLTEAPRGALGHWVQIAGGKIARYQIITPTCWNASPRDSSGKRGPIEEALIGTPVKNINEPIEVVRVIHSFDPCLSCAVHVMRPTDDATIFALGHYHGEDEITTHDHSDGHMHSHHTHEHDHA